MSKRACPYQPGAINPDVCEALDLNNFAHCKKCDRRVSHARVSAVEPH
jgi:hypothetical protein